MKSALLAAALLLIPAAASAQGAATLRAVTTDADGRITLGDLFVNAGAAAHVQVGTRSGPSAVLDASSLRPLLTLTRWEHVGGIGDRILMARDDASVLRTWFGELDPAGPSLRVFGSATGVLADQCVHSDTYLVCPTTKNQLRLWRLHPLP